MAVHSDELLYGDLAFFHTHPNHLASLAALCGLPMPEVESCRVLEIACGTGFNLLAMGRSLPQARFVGIDLSARQIEHGRGLAAEAGVTNVELQTGRLEEIGAGWGMFDFIVAHGVFSWVPPEVQSALLGLIRDRLAPEGLGYISYNTLPGWHSRGLLRDAMRFLDPRELPAHERVRTVKERVQRLIDSMPEADAIHRHTLRSEFEAMRSEADYYILNEYLAEYNRPLLFTDFASLLGGHGLQYVAESRFGTSAFAQIGSDRTALDAVGDDLIRREQYHDFRWHRYFRQSVVCRAERTVSRSPNARDISRLWLHPRVELLEPLGDVDETESDDARREEDGEIVQIRDPLYRRFLRRLRSTPGHSLQLSAFQADLDEMIPLPLGHEETLRLLAQVVVKGTIEEVWHLYATAPPRALTAGVFPRGCPLARFQARTSTAVTNKLHRTAKLFERERELLLWLDGSHSRAELMRGTPELDALLARLANLAVLDG